MAARPSSLLIKLLVVLIYTLVTTGQNVPATPGPSASKASPAPTPQQSPSGLQWAADGTPIIPDHIVDLYSDPSLTVGEKWAIIGHFYNDFAWPHRRKIIEYLGRAVAEKRLKFSPKCKKSLTLLRKGLEESTLWAFEVMDSMAKMRPGFLSGEYGDFGKWDECIEMKYDEAKMSFTGKYCLYGMHFPQPVDTNEANELIEHFNGTWMEDIVRHHHMFRVAPVTNAICFPSVCSQEEIQTAVQFYLDEADVPIEFKFHDQCETIDRYSVPYSSMPIWKQAAGYTLLTIVALVAVSTFVSHYYPDHLPRWLRHWDAKANTDKIFEDVTDEEKSRLNFLRMDSVLRLVIIYSSHICFLSGITTPETHFTLLNFGGVDLNPFLGNYLSYTFVCENVVGFVLGGLVAYSSYHAAMAKADAVGLLGHVMRRVLKTLPMIAGTLLIIFAFPPNFGAGPLFMKGYQNVTENCLKNWWKELLYIGNQNDASEACLLHGWTVGVEMQLYVFSFFLMLALYKAPKVGIALCSMAIAAGIVFEVSNMRSYSGNHWNLSSIEIFQTIAQLRFTQFATLNHLAPYAFGLLCGHCISKKVVLGDAKLLMGWSAIIGLAATFAHLAHQGLNNDLSRSQELLVGATIRPFVGLLGFWFFYNLWLNRIPLVGKVANANVWVYFGRINFATYMLHFLFVWYNNFSMRQPIEYRGFPLTMRLISELVISHFLGYVGYLLFEAPSSSIVKAILSPPARASTADRGDASKRTTTSDVNANLDKDKKAN